MNSAAFRQLSVFDGTKAISVDQLPESAWRYVLRHGVDEGKISPEAVYRAVPFIYRGVTMRAQALADLPWALVQGEREVVTSEDLSTLPKGLEWLAHLSGLLQRVEMALCLWGAAYLLHERNRVRTLGYRWLLPATITPVYDTNAGLIGWKRKVGGQDRDLKREALVYWWLPTVDAELGPGTSPVQAALRAAGLVHNVDLFSEGFFQRGAINMTLLSVEGNPAPEEMRRLEQWWKRLLAGVKRAWETVAVRASVKPIPIANPPKDLAMVELVESKRQDIATALGIPLSLLTSDAANFATAQQDDLNFYSKTILPEAEFIEQALNEQIFAALGYDFRFQPEKLEVIEQHETQKAFALIAAVQGKVMTPNEWREKMDMEPIEGGDELVQVQTTPKFGSDAESRGQVAADNGATPGAQDRKRWERKAQKALKAGRSPNVAFKSAGIDSEEQAAIRVALAQAQTPEEVTAAFVPSAEGESLEQELKDYFARQRERVWRITRDELALEGD